MEIPVLINVIGRQRMLSYKIITAILMSRSRSGGLHQQELATARDLYLTTHANLTKTISDLGADGIDRTVIKEIVAFADWIKALDADDLSGLANDEIDRWVSTGVPAQVNAINAVLKALEEVVERQEAGREEQMDLDRQLVSSIAGELQDIAKRISLIALNARIEAARAGDFGRAFSVIADEVKQLSEVSALKADEINARVSVQ